MLQGHLARANPLWKTIAPETPVLVIFGGANRYITPSWYPGKQEHGKVVPTWNYSVVHAHGTIRKASQHRPESERSVVAAALAAEGASAADLNEVIRSPKQ